MAAQSNETKKGVTLSDYTFFDSDLSSTLLDLLKVRIRDSIITAIVLRALVRVAALEATAHVVRVEAALRAALGKEMAKYDVRQIGLCMEDM